MSEQLISTPYSREALEALRETLQLHRGIIWVDPTTNQLAVKRIEPVAPAADHEDQTWPLHA